MPESLQQRCETCASAELLGALAGINRGIEKEGLRTNPDGELAQTPHPHSLGSALTNPYITTDYSEALLEFITPVIKSPEDAVEFLCDIHKFVYSHLGDELIWVASMPCFLGGEDSIPIARYGSSNVGTLKHVYRVGLSYRYGKMMQTVAGIHYNFSLPRDFWPVYQRALGAEGDVQDFQSAQYFSLIRNFRRYSWLILYLFGASPAVCGSFLQGQQHDLQSMDGRALYLPWATSLRMGDLGYTSEAQAELEVSYNSLDEYVRTLGDALTIPYPAYEAFGVARDGEYRQLNTNLLQIENEYYSEIRPKRVTPSGRKPLQILEAQGVEYIEIRNLDINPFLPVGIDAEQIRFMDSFLLYCLLENSPLIDAAESARNRGNKALVINRGRDPVLRLQNGAGSETTLRDWAEDLFDGIQFCAELLDRANGGNRYRAVVARQRQSVERPELTPSARVLEVLEQESLSFYEFGMRQAQRHRDRLAAELDPELYKRFTQAAEKSLAKQAQIEADDTVPFDEFLRCYLAQ